MEKNLSWEEEIVKSMTAGRNDPCPCGSGKKYKKCCYLNEKNTVSGNSMAPQDVQDDPNDFFEDQEFWIRGLINLRKYTLDKKPHIKAYYAIRKMHGEIIDAMIRYFENGKFKQKADTDYLPAKSKDENQIYLLESEFDLETRIGAQSFYDMMIYKPSANTSCIVEDFIGANRYRKPGKVELLHSMLNSKLGLFEITSIDSDEGYAYLKEVFTGAEYKITDVGLSGDTNYDGFYLYTRIIHYHGINFGTGLNLIFAKTDSFIEEHIRQHKKDYSPHGEFLRFTQLYNRCCAFPDKIRVVTNTFS